MSTEYVKTTARTTVSQKFSGTNSVIAPMPLASNNIEYINITYTCSGTVGTRDLSLYYFDTNSVSGGNAFYFATLGAPTAGDILSITAGPGIQTNNTPDALGLTYLNLPGLALSNLANISVIDDSGVSASDSVDVIISVTG